MAGTGDRDLVLVFMIDALGHELVGSGGFLDHIAAAPRPRLRSIFGFSSGAIPSIFTGRMPREHGHWSMYRRDMGASIFRRYRVPLSIAARIPRGHWRVRRWLADRLRRDGLTGYFSLYEIPLELIHHFDLCERRNIYRPGAFDGIPGFFDRLVQHAVSYRVWDWSCRTESALAEMEREAAAGRHRLLFLYTPDFDATMHVHGPRSEAARSWLVWMEERIEKILEIARASGRRPILRVFGDHGMAAVHKELDISGIMASLSLRMPKDYLMFLDSSMARFWFHSQTAERAIRQRLGGLSGGRWVPQEEMDELGVGFADRAYGEAVYLCDPGVVILPSFMGSAPLAGMHGYHPDDADSYTTLLSDSPVEPAPESILHLSQVLLRDLGIGPEG